MRYAPYTHHGALLNHDPDASPTNLKFDSVGVRAVYVCNQLPERNGKDCTAANLLLGMPR